MKLSEVQDDQGAEAYDIQGEAESTGFVQLQGEKAQGRPVARYREKEARLFLENKGQQTQPGTQKFQADQDIFF